MTRAAELMRRRSCLALGGAALLAGCALAPQRRAPRLVDVASGGAMTREDVLARMRASDLVLLGELHDNTLHHEARAALLRDVGAVAAVVVEHLPRGAAPVLAHDADSAALLAALAAAGFDARGWRWPLHEPVFAALARSGLALRGGNLDRDSARRIAREGAGATPSELATALAAAPLSATAHDQLAQDLLRSHCGQLKPERVPGLLAAQRARDAAMALALAAELDRSPATARRAPVVLLAGNGHVRLDYGVPQILAAWRPSATLLSIGFLEPEAPAPVPGLPFHVTWTTASVPRDDPCKGMPGYVAR